MRTGAILAAALLATTLQAQDPLKLLPRNYSLVFENKAVRVLRVRYEAHEKLPAHNHSTRPTVYVYLTDSGPVRFTHIETEAFTIDRPAVKAGTFRVSPGRIEKHAVENLGSIPTVFLRIELKQVPRGFRKNAYRDTKPPDLTRPGVSTEFTDTPFRIERIVSLAGRRVEVSEPEKPSLLIAFTPTVAPAMKAFDVLWEPPRQHLAVEGAAHLLRIVFP